MCHCKNCQCTIFFTITAANNLLTRAIHHLKIGKLDDWIFTFIFNFKKRILRNCKFNQSPRCIGTSFTNQFSCQIYSNCTSVPTITKIKFSAFRTFVEGSANRTYIRISIPTIPLRSTGIVNKMDVCPFAIINVDFPTRSSISCRLKELINMFICVGRWKIGCFN